MARSLGLTAYRAFSRRSHERGFKPSTARPKGTLLWLHAGEPKDMLAVEDLAQRLCAARFDLHVMITLPDQRSFEAAKRNCLPHDFICFELVPSEHPDAVRSFWRHWKPDIAIWIWGALRPNLVDHVHRNRCPIALIDADSAGFDTRRDTWFPDVTRQLLEPFIGLIARSSDAFNKLQNLGLNGARISVTSPLQAGGHILPCNDADLMELSKTFSGRPVWLASNIQHAELSAVLDAHRQALRLSHRLLLVLSPAPDASIKEFTDDVAREGFRLCDWTESLDLDDSTQVLLAPEQSDLGLFYRVAPVTFMGSSLIQGYGGRTPFEAAALGSAVLYGPHVSRFMPFYSRLAKAGAARIVKDGKSLGNAVTQLIAPDQAATMAHAGWDVVSQGADLTDRVIDLVHAALDGELEAHNARS